MDSPDGSLSTLDSNATSQNGQESLSSQQKRCHRSEEPFHHSRAQEKEPFQHSRAQELRSSHIAVKFEEPSTSISFPRDLEKIQPPLEYIDAGPPDPVLDLVPHGNFPATQSFPHSPYCFGLNTDSCVFLQSPETTSYFRGSDNGRSITESPSLNEKAMHDEVRRTKFFFYSYELTSISRTYLLAYISTGV